MIALAAGMLPLLAGMWPRFELAHVRAMHERLAAARCAGAAAASVNGEGGAGGEGAAAAGGEGEGGARPKHDAEGRSADRAAHRAASASTTPASPSGSRWGRKTPRTRRRGTKARAS